MTRALDVQRYVRERLGSELNGVDGHDLESGLNGADGYDWKVPGTKQTKLYGKG